MLVYGNLILAFVCYLGAIVTLADRADWPLAAILFALGAGLTAYGLRRMRPGDSSPPSETD